MKTSHSHPARRAAVSPMSRSMLQITAASSFGLPRPPRRRATDASRKGKIARLPLEVREQLNGRLREGEPGRVLIAWLNGLPEVQAVLATGFGGRPINEPNFTAWRHGGYRDWLKLQESRRMAEILGKQAVSGKTLDAEAEGHPTLTETLSTWVTAQYGWATKDLRSSRSARGWRLLRELTADIVSLRRGDHQTQRLEMDREWRRTRIALAAEFGVDPSGVKCPFPRRRQRGSRRRGVGRQGVSRSAPRAAVPPEEPGSSAVPGSSVSGGNEPTEFHEPCGNGPTGSHAPPNNGSCVPNGMGMETSSPTAPGDQTATPNPEPAFTLEAKGNLSQIRPHNDATKCAPDSSAPAHERGRGGSAAPPAAASPGTGASRPDGAALPEATKDGAARHPDRDPMANAPSPSPSSIPPLAGRCEIQQRGAGEDLPRPGEDPLPDPAKPILKPTFPDATPARSC